MLAPASTLRSRLQRTGIHRSGGPGGGFRYRRANGAAVSAAERRRIARLRVPPAWREVAIAPRAGAKVQAVGQDAAGRWQYLYLKDHTARRARRKFGRLLAFARALPLVRAAVRRDLARPGMPLERACAVAVLLLGAAALRPGTERYARENGAFGLATLRPRHVSVNGAAVRLTFRGKHGVRQEKLLRGARLARLVREMLRMPGRELFKYRGPNGAVRDLRAAHLNAYVKRAMGARFTAKDFRTWCATVYCAGVLSRSSLAIVELLAADAVTRERSVARLREHAIRVALAMTAAWLGNTPAVVRESYVHPAVLDAFREGHGVACALERPEVLAERVPHGLHRAEREVVRVIAEA